MKKILLAGFLLAVPLVSAQAQTALPPQTVDAIRARLNGCWQPEMADWNAFRPSAIRVSIAYDLQGIPRKVALAPQDEQRFRQSGPAFKRAALSALNTAAMCDLKPLALPQNLYSAWRQIEMNFDATQRIANGGPTPPPKPADPEAELRQQLKVMDVQ